MNRRRTLLILSWALLVLVCTPIVFWLWPVSLPPIPAEEVVEISCPLQYGWPENYRVTDRQQIDRLVERFNKITVRRYLPGYQSELPTTDIVFWDADGRELRRLSVYSVPAGYQVFSADYQAYSEDEKYAPKGIRVLVQDDFLWQVRNDGLEFFFEELKQFYSSSQ